MRESGSVSTTSTFRRPYRGSVAWSAVVSALPAGMGERRSTGASIVCWCKEGEGPMSRLVIYRGSLQRCQKFLERVDPLRGGRAARLGGVMRRALEGFELRLEPILGLRFAEAHLDARFVAQGLQERDVFLRSDFGSFAVWPMASPFPSQV